MSSTPFDSEEFRRAHERRRVPRVRLPSLAYVDVDADNGGILLNLSETGLALQAVAPFAGLTRVALRIQPPKPRKRLDLNAEITWLSESKKEAGFQFLELEDDTRIEIANWISAEGCAREPSVTGDSAAPLPAQVSSAHFPEEAPVPRRKWSRRLEDSSSLDAPPNQKIPAELPSPSIASANLELRATPIRREQSVDDPAHNLAPSNENILASTSSPIEWPVEPIVFSEQASPAAPSPSEELPHPEVVRPRRQKWSFLLKNSPAPDAPPLQKPPSEIPSPSMRGTYLERLTDAILRRQSVDVTPRNPIATNEKILTRTGSANVQPDSAIILSQNVSDAAQFSSIEPAPPPAQSAPTPPLRVTAQSIPPPPAPSAELIARRDQTPKTFISSSSEKFPRSGERRRLPRRRIYALAYLEVGSDNGGMVLDLSEYGLALQAFNPLIDLTRVNLRIQPPKSRKKIVATAEITWLSESQTEAGLRFLDLSEDARMEIADWVSAETAAPEPPLLDESASQKTTEVPSAQVSSAPVYGGQDRNWEEWSRLLNDLNPGESSADQNGFNDSLHSPTHSGPFALQPGSARSEKFSAHPANHPDSSPQALHQLAVDEKILPAARPISSASDSHVKRPPLDSPAPPAAVSKLLLSEQFRKRGTIAVVCTCIALVFLFLGMAISRTFLSDRATRLNAEEHARDAAASATPPVTIATPVTLGTPGKIDAPSGSAAFPTEASVSKTRQREQANLSLPPQKEIRDKNNREHPKPRATNDEADPIAAALPPAIVPSPGTGKSGSQNVAVPSLPVWSVQAAGNHNLVAGTPATNTALPRVPERRSDCYLLYRVEPLYPREAREQHIEGTVVVHLQIGTDGHVRSSRELSGPAPLVPAALAAVREWRYIPALLNGQPIDTEKDVSVEFQLSR